MGVQLGQEPEQRQRHDEHRTQAGHLGSVEAVGEVEDVEAQPPPVWVADVQPDYPGVPEGVEDEDGRDRYEEAPCLPLPAYP